MVAIGRYTEPGRAGEEGSEPRRTRRTGPARRGSPAGIRERRYRESRYTEPGRAGEEGSEPRRTRRTGPGRRRSPADTGCEHVGDAGSFLAPHAVRGVIGEPKRLACIADPTRTMPRRVACPKVFNGPEAQRRFGRDERLDRRGDRSYPMTSFLDPSASAGRRFFPGRVAGRPVLLRPSASAGRRFFLGRVAGRPVLLRPSAGAGCRFFLGRVAGRPVLLRPSAGAGRRFFLGRVAGRLFDDVDVAGSAAGGLTGFAAGRVAAV